MDLKQIVGQILDTINAILTASKVGKADREAKEKQDPIERKRERHLDEKVALISMQYDDECDEYVWDEWTNVKRRDVPHDAVHLTGRKRTYVHVGHEIADALDWPYKGQSAIHMYLWVINEHINPDALSDRGKKSDIDIKKLVMYGAIGMVILIVSWGFIK